MGASLSIVTVFPDTVLNKGGVKMIVFQMVVRQRVVTCELVQKRLPRSRLLFTAQGVEFWVIGAIGANFDRVANVAMNAMIEIGRKPSELRTNR